MSLKPGYRCNALRREQFKFDDAIRAYRRQETWKERMDHLLDLYPFTCLLAVGCLGLAAVMGEMWVIRFFFGTP